MIYFSSDNQHEASVLPKSANHLPHLRVIYLFGESSLLLSFVFLSFLKTEKDEKKSTESAVDLWSEKPITTEERWYLSPGNGHILPFC